MIIGIDPSYSGTGICVTNDDATEIYYKDRFDSECAVYDNRGYAKGCKAIYDKVADVIFTMEESHPGEPIKIICEYPGFRSMSGAWLAILHGWLDCLFSTVWAKIEEVVWVPPTACDSYTKNKEHRKSYLTKYCVEQGWVVKKVNHDISTALIFCHLYLDIRDGKYKGVTFRYGNKDRIPEEG